jgi:hypothetical protein
VAVEVIKHAFSGQREWEISVYATGNRWKKWNAKIRQEDGFHSDYMFGDPFGARTSEGALKKAMREVRRCDDILARDDALAAALYGKDFHPLP